LRSSMAGVGGDGTKGRKIISVPLPTAENIKEIRQMRKASRRGGWCCRAQRSLCRGRRAISLRPWRPLAGCLGIPGNQRLAYEPGMRPHPGGSAVISSIGSRERFVQYISTRGEAPALGFIDVTLAGLARDGGLYVPQMWPTLDPARIAGFAGRAYAEVAC